MGEAVTTYDLHIGMTEANYNRWEQHTDLPVGTDLDGWNVWGERPGTDRNDTLTIHVIVQSPSQFMLTALAAYLTTEHRDSLVPMGGYPQQNGILTVITDHADWSDVLEETRA